MFLQIQGMELRLLDPKSSTVLSVQLINKIRVWGIGKDNERYDMELVYLKVELYFFLLNSS